MFAIWYHYYWSAKKDRGKEAKRCFRSPAVLYVHVPHDETIQGVFFARRAAVNDHALILV